MIEIKELSQSYQNKVVLKDINLMIEKNEICALVGSNGAGKSTLIHSMLHLIPVKKGIIKLSGIPHNKEEWKKNVAYLPEKFLLYPHMTGEENMNFFASLGNGPMDGKRMEEMLRKVKLWDHRSDLIKGYSKGMLQRLGLGIMLYFDSSILILDEPTSGLDPKGRSEILTILRSLEDKTILFSSHHMDEIRQICTHVAYLEEGEIRKFTLNDFYDQYIVGGLL
ncbi:ABC transporter ATP-binding protein [Neobacillus sp. OS1-33]|jgi:ABC-2 type transport system ATP-binding protein|uniref:ABC transporter ATP-binding protein n=1 Tax=Neobacillus sp. OS1-33 TaxID=3070683 RepID=UPI0027E1E482|nr:ABC transporter ATP-binding protein [Neobacillus sp. OS1-33]WML25370.1 ABC transporter ATP-binding protein [Neobacillus sp. OS1-33]